MELNFPPYSFVQLQAESPDCYPDAVQCMPCSGPLSLQFCGAISGIPDTYNTDSYLCELVAYPISVDGDADLLNETGDILENEDGIQDLLNEASSAFICSFADIATEPTKPALVTSRYARTSKTADSRTTFKLTTLAFNEDPISSFDLYNAAALASGGLVVQLGQCFKLQFAILIFHYDNTSHTRGAFVSGQYLGCSDCFIRIAENDCYYSSVSYLNADDSFGFPFSITQIPCVAELPMYLRDPSLVEDQKIYKRSDGSNMKVFDRKDEVYELETDMIPYKWLRALDIALSCDQVEISNVNASSFDPVNTATQFVKEEKLEIAYQKGPLTALGKGTCKVKNASPLSLINNNCE
jgi:hypothetical protein